MAKIKMFGIYKDTSMKGWLWSVAVDSYGLHYSWRFSEDDFINGWFRPSGIEEGGWNQRLGRPKKKRGSAYLKTEGFFREVYEKRGKMVPDIFMEGFRGFKVTPTFLRNCGRVLVESSKNGASGKLRGVKYGKTNAHRIKWAEAKKGNWGGKR